MGSWTNLTGTLIQQACIKNKCGQPPVAIQVTSTTSPAVISEYIRKKQDYEICTATCLNTRISGVSREGQVTMLDSEKTTTLDKGEPIPAVGYETKPAETKLKTSNILLIGLLVAVAGGVWYFTKKK